MRKRLVLLVSVAAVFLAIPAEAQHRRSSSGFSVRPTWHRAPHTNTGSPDWNFIPGFGLRPVVRERFPTPGFGFDFEHDRLVRGRHRHPGFFPGRIGHRGFVGGSFFGPNFGVGGFFPFPIGSTSTSVVYVQQPVPVIVEDLRDYRDPRDDYSDDVVVAPGLPDDWPRLRIAANSYTPVHPPLPALTLLVLKNEKILAVKEYWLEDGKIFYVTSSGRQGSFAVRELDWEMTRRLNHDRGLDFALGNEE
ncbi:MAG TPA: hypothetical protein VNN18_11465 [Candidatus Xenobia bacterium]|nr:hypothetical protein [Candidatus Xenobia bacterium]